ncbi:LLM class F420-dependent oxidoreductase [Frankia sp. AiPs1]|uniref:LLM class flavin-dependent oxidoreductase n=1 Tax=Frankia sp. AiPa1 TaxID=573492 RepID=UPI00202B9FE2|nr:LLM class flavin-dependent oxidoreductase [Frankia sp. AiPa1]MCL9758730.1 LLM class flavin-dependent oxidoreductase [Frankia sp. AiPa1]
MTSPSPSPRWGVNLPLPGLPLREQGRIVRVLPDLGFTDVWTAEGGGIDAFTPLAAAAAWQPRLRVGTGVVPAQTRGAGVLAQTALGLAELAEGGVLLGVGSSVPAHVTALNGLPHGRPLETVRNTVRALRQNLAGQVPKPPKVIVGALRPRMLRLGYEEADGAILNVLCARDVPRVIEAAGGPRSDRETVVKLFLCPTEDIATARQAGRAFLGWILNQAPYHAFHEWLGRGEVLRASYERYQAGDRRGAELALPDDLVDELWLSGRPAELRDRIAGFLHPGVTTILLYVAGTPELVADPARLPQLLADLRPDA